MKQTTAPAPREEGVALIAALLAVVILSGLVVLFVARAVNESGFSAFSRDHETAIHVAEAASDEVLSHVNLEGETFATRFITLDADGKPHEYDLDTLQGDQTAEKAWAIGLALAAGAEGQLLQTSTGQAYGIRPKIEGEQEVLQAVFGVGFVPSWDAPNRRTRVIKLLIDKEFFNPSFAVRSEGNLKIGGNASILAAGCDPNDPDPDACNAHVEVNGDVDVTGSAHQIQGELSYTGSASGSPNAVGGSSQVNQLEDVPDIFAEHFYDRDVQLNTDPHTGQPAEWHDLCPDGTVRPRAVPPANGPCTNTTILWSSAEPTNFRGWKFKSQNNIWEAQKVDFGLYYVYKADASINGSAPENQRAVSVFVQADPDKPKRSGSLELSGNPDLVAAFPDVLFVADRDLKMKGTSSGGTKDTCDPNVVGDCDVQSYTGFITAGEQIDVSGTVRLKGSMLEQDREDEHGLVKRNTAGINGNMILDFDPTLKIDLTGAVTITFWNEL